MPNKIFAFPLYQRSAYKIQHIITYRKVCMSDNLVNIDKSKSERQLEFFNSLDSEDYNTYLDKIPADKLSKIKKSVKRMQTGVHASAPLTCLGPDNCPFVRKCPIPTVNFDGTLNKGEPSDYPLGKECVMEKFYVEQKIVDYLNYLDVDPNNPVEMSIVNELALIDLYKNRCLFVLANGDKKGDGRDFLMTDVTGFNENGDKAETTKLHPVIDMIDRLEKRRERWLERLMETRKAKSELMLKMGENKNNSKVLSEIQALRKALSSIEVEGDDEEILIDD